jgi:hypothetical protein
MFSIREPYAPQLAGPSRGSIARVGSIEGALANPALLAQNMIGLGAVGALGGAVVGAAIGHLGIGAAVGGLAGAAVGFGWIAATY